MLGLNQLRNAIQSLAAHSGKNPSFLTLFPAVSAPPSIVGQSIRNINIKTFQIPDNKRIEVGLQRIHGVGPRRAHQILCELGIVNKSAKELTPRERFSIGEEVFRYLIDRELMQANRSAVERLKHINCYRGSRHTSKLPCRGQRTHTNARTLKGSRGVAIASRKKI